MAKSYYFYVLYCRDDTLYGGFTTNLQAREATHNAGKGAKYTRVRSRQPVRMIYAERFSDKRQAMRSEYQFKQLTRAAKEQYLRQHGIVNVKEASFVLVNGEELSDAKTEEF
ncbi:hypothetical protein CL176_00270 [Suicoccus acidiformans]|uniref:GIY-YIG domain-containing protein n=1 Tax=Suicoccus acidiformans TaxID=2036206 RepID=A0A347WHM8_9LACT|nr:GIY-YIG nuclease family protein [Suicoccus acidiformans]AXY24585.1 hypothetical protein CL176_00270 [Suicoccus acidiformans]